MNFWTQVDNNLIENNVISSQKREADDIEPCGQNNGDRNCENSGRWCRPVDSRQRNIARQFAKFWGEILKQKSFKNHQLRCEDLQLWNENQRKIKHNLNSEVEKQTLKLSALAGQEELDEERAQQKQKRDEARDKREKARVKKKEEEAKALSKEVARLEKILADGKDETGDLNEFEVKKYERELDEAKVKERAQQMAAAKSDTANPADRVGTDRG